MAEVVNIIKMVCALVAAILTGNWFMAEVRGAKIRREPWYRPYLSLPGMMIILFFLFVPVILWLARR